MIILDLLKKFEVHSILIVAFLIFLQRYAIPQEKMPVAVGVDFEVFGKVQGVFFRKSTASKAKELGLKGWCMNTEQGTVRGYVEGNTNKINEMKTWLQKTGSPQSSIEKAEFRNEKALDSLTLDSFTIKK